MNIVTELNRIAQQSKLSELKEADNLLESVKENLTTADSKDSEMLKYFGTGQVIQSGVSKKQEAERKLQNGSITRGDIKSLCLDYGLRFLQSKYYKKEIPLRALNDLRKFSETTTVYPENLFVIAPASHFELGPRPKKDPVLLYNTGDTFKVISTWGDDFKWTRRLYGEFTSGAVGALLGLASMIGFFIFFVLACFNEQGGYMIGAAACGAVALIAVNFSKADNEDTWDKPTK